MVNYLNCPHCNNKTDFTFKFCPQCGNVLYFDLGKIDKSKRELNDQSFIQILTSVYNFVFNPISQDKELYSQPVSRQLMSNRYKLEYKTDEKVALISSPESIEKQNHPLQIRFNLCLFNARTGYSVRTAEELISKNVTTPLNIHEIEGAVKLIEKIYANEYLIKDVILKESNEHYKRRLLFIVYLQDDNKHMNYFLEEEVLARTWDSIIDSNVKSFIEETKSKMVIDEKSIVEEVINDLVFGYCVKLSESLYPIR